MPIRPPGSRAKSEKLSRTFRRPRRTRIESLEPRIALHAGEDHGEEESEAEEEHEEEHDHNETANLGDWLQHTIYDDAIFDATAGNEPNPTLVEALAEPDAPASEVGQWSPLEAWPLNFINALMLPTGKVLGYDRNLNLRLWDPTTGEFTSPADPGYDIFCTGTALLADGTVLVTGGHVVDSVGLPYASIYDPFEDTWTQLSNMNSGRWYPSQTTLANGDVLVLSGDTNGPRTNPLPQIYEAATGTWRDLTTAEQTLSYYPRTFSAPNGAAFIAGPDPLSQYLDVTGTGQWIPVDYRIHPYRDFGSAVMYAPGKILYVGGGQPATATAEVIDLNDPNPEWRAVGSMEFARRNLNATLLPNGEVLIVGGHAGSLNYDGQAILATEIWNPVTETFRTVANMDDIRWYHSTAVLLPDGRVLSAGGDLHMTGQVYSPAYLFQGARPTITTAPETVRYGDTFAVTTPDAAEITQVRWIRLGTATHAQDWDQYIQESAFSVTAGGLQVSAPPTPNTAPPGYYMLLVLKGDVPSIGEIIKVGPNVPEVSVEAASVTERANGVSRELVFTVSLELASAETVTVGYATANGTAIAGQDYLAQAGTITFAPLQKTQTITVTVVGDGLAEATEDFTLNLLTPTGALLPASGASALGTIRDFATLPVLSIEDTTLVEGDAGVSYATFAVSLSDAPTTTPITVVYQTVDGTAKAGQSYVATTGTLTFGIGITAQDIVIPVIGDTMDEYNNSFLVKLVNPVGAQIDVATPEGLGLIVNNDDPVSVSFLGTESVVEPTTGTGTITFTVALSAPSGKDIEMHWNTGVDGSAVAGVNYVDTVGVILFEPGETVRTFSVTVLHDNVKTFPLTFSVQMQSELRNANYGNRYIPATIFDADPLPAVSLSKPTAAEGAAGTSTLVFTATLTVPMAVPVTVAYATLPGTATAGVDYVTAFGTITFAAGAVTQSITVLKVGDAAPESDETFNLVLSNPVNVILNGGTSVGTIVDDDGSPAPAAPANLTAVAGFASAALTWQPVAGATSYRVYRGTTRNGEGTTPIATGLAAPTYVDDGLVIGENYFYWVTAVVAGFEGVSSPEAQIKTSGYDFSAGFFNANQVLQLNGYNIHNVRLFGASMQLTDGGTNQTDSVFTRNKVDVARFTSQFVFHIIPSVGYVDTLADGFTFTIQGVAPTAMGVNGAGLGYSGIADSVAIKFDLYNGTGAGNSSTGLYLDGAMPEALGSINLDGAGIDLHGGNPFRVDLAYDGTTLLVTITDTVTLATATQTYTVDIPAIVGGDQAYVGFTGGTGGLTAVQKIESWSFTPAPAPPTALAVTGTTPTTVGLAWTNVDPNTTSIIIERKTGAGGAYAPVGLPLAATATTFSDATVTAGLTYTYRVRAAIGNSTSVPSAEVVATPGNAGAPTLDFSAGFAAAGGVLTLNGPAAAIVGSKLQLTSGAVLQASSVFASTPVDVTQFTTEFEFQLLSGTAFTADGMTFTIQGVGPAALGGSGGALGYASIAQSVAIKFDLFDNTGEGPNSTGLYTGGPQPNQVGSISLVGSGIDLHSGHVFRVQMAYNGTALEVVITDTVTLATTTKTYTVDIPTLVGGNTAYVGFTASTGGLTAVQDVLNWTFSNGTQAVPPAAPTGLAASGVTETQVTLSWVNVAAGTTVAIERRTGVAGTYAQIGTTTVAGDNDYVDLTVAPGVTYYYRVRATNGVTYSVYSDPLLVTTPAANAQTLDFSNGFAGAAGALTFNGPSAAIAGTRLQLTNGGALQAASVFASTPVDITQFNTDFEIQLLSGTAFTADGMTFTIQGVGPAAIGGSGGALGYAAITKSVAVKFDLFDNTGEGPNSTGLYVGGPQPNEVGSISLVGSGIDLHSGHVLRVQMAYNGTALQVVITDTVTLATATQTYTVNIPAIVAGNTAYVGFTAGTGGLTAVQDVLNWTFASGTQSAPPAAPTGLAAGGVTDAQVTLSWVNVAAGTTVSIERRTGVAGTYAQIGATTVAGDNDFVDLTVAPGVTYYYRVRATNGLTYSVYSDPIIVTTPVIDLITLDFSNGFAGAAGALTFNGPTAAINGTKLQLTNGGALQAASVFASTPVDVTQFTNEFDFQLLSGTAFTADGMTFTIQGVGPTALGGSGGALGYASIAQSVAIKFDLFDNTGEGPNSTGLYTGGPQPNEVGSISLVGSGIDLHSGHVFHVQMSYNGTALEVVIGDTVTLATATQTYTVNIPAIVGGNTAYVGFTAGTGGLTAVQEILSWTLDSATPGAPLAEPGAESTLSVSDDEEPMAMPMSFAATNFPQQLDAVGFLAFVQSARPNEEPLPLTTTNRLLQAQPLTLADFLATYQTHLRHATQSGIANAPEVALENVEALRTGQYPSSLSLAQRRWLFRLELELLGT
jgi:hypothetical protein